MPSTHAPKQAAQPTRERQVRRGEPEHGGRPGSELLGLRQRIGNRATGLLLQTTLRVGAANDRYEQEADRVAAQVLRMPERTLQRQCAGCAGGEPCDECEDEQVPVIRRVANASGGGFTVPDAVVSGLGAGTRLDPESRTFFERRFGHDFGGVAVHTSPAADRSARAVEARAFTVGRDIAFGAGEYAPATLEGRRLLAHELAHVVQQAGGAGQGDPSGSASAPSLTPSPVRLARNGRPFRIRQSDMHHLRDTMVRLFDSLDPDTRAGIARNRTVVVGLVTDPDGDPTLVYTVNNNWTNRQLEEAAHRLGIARWTATPRTEGRGAVGAPGDAEQIMMEAADANDFRVRGMAVSRGMCDDCAVATRTAEGGRIRVVEVPIRATSTTPRPAGPTPLTTHPPGESGPGGPTRLTAPRPGEPPGPGPVRITAPPRGESPRGGPVRITAPRTGDVPRVGAPARVGTSRGIGGPVRLGTLPRLALGGAAAAAGIVLAIVDLLIQLIVIPWLERIQRELEEDYRQRLERELQRYYETHLQRDVERLAWCGRERVRELENAGRTAYVNVSLRLFFYDDRPSLLGAPSGEPESILDFAFHRMEVSTVDVSDSAAVRSATEFADTGERTFALMGSGRAIYAQTVTLAFEAPSAADLDAQYADLERPPSCASCFIATACCGSADAPEVASLRAFRDRVLEPCLMGKAFVRLYYAVSPPFADWLRAHPHARRAVRVGMIAPLARLADCLTPGPVGGGWGKTRTSPFRAVDFPIRFRDSSGR